MNVKDLIKKLDNLSSQIEDLHGESIKSLQRTIEEIRNEIDNLTETLGDEGIEKEEVEEDEEE